MSIPDFFIETATLLKKIISSPDNRKEKQRESETAMEEKEIHELLVQDITNMKIDTLMALEVNPQ